MIKEFIPDEAKVSDLSDKLKSRWLYLSDEHRNDETVSAILMYHFFGPQEHMMFEIGEWQGLFGAVGIIPGWKANLFFKIWDNSAYGPDLRRELGSSIDAIMERYKLERIFLETPDAHTAKLAKVYGFVEEGLLKNHFKWDGVSYDVLCLGLNRRT